MPRLLLFLLPFLFLACATSDQPGQYSTEDTIIPNDSIRLSARIYKPGGQGPFPAVVLLHGSKNHTKDYYTEYSEYFAAHGIVVANYDKRGQGQSTGNLWTATFHGLADDAVAVVEHLASQPYVDDSRIGLWADSQGGWVALLADSLSPQISFIINKSGPAVTPLAQTLYDTRENYLEANGVPEDIQDELLNLYPQILEYLTRNREEALWREIHCPYHEALRRLQGSSTGTGHYDRPVDAAGHGLRISRHLPGRPLRTDAQGQGLGCPLVLYPRKRTIDHPCEETG
ncbi:MAG: alpha/beta hydrolase [Nitrospira sp.]|nr:alpha/beta hydrolase [Nitrospira sp.]